MTDDSEPRRRPARRLGAAPLAANLVVFLAAFGLLTARPFRISQLLPGVALAAAGALALQAAGSWYVERAVSRASEAYGTFALIIGLLSWFWLFSHLLLLAARDQRRPAQAPMAPFAHRPPWRPRTGPRGRRSSSASGPRL